MSFRDENAKYKAQSHLARTLCKDANEENSPAGSSNSDNNQKRLVSSDSSAKASGFNTATNTNDSKGADSSKEGHNSTTRGIHVKSINDEIKSALINQQNINFYQNERRDDYHSNNIYSQYEKTKTNMSGQRDWKGPLIPSFKPEYKNNTHHKFKREEGENNYIKGQVDQQDSRSKLMPNQSRIYRNNPSPHKNKELENVTSGGSHGNSFLDSQCGNSVREKESKRESGKESRGNSLLKSADEMKQELSKSLLSSKKFEEDERITEEFEDREIYSLKENKSKSSYNNEREAPKSQPIYTINSNPQLNIMNHNYPYQNQNLSGTYPYSNYENPTGITQPQLSYMIPQQNNPYIQQQMMGMRGVQPGFYPGVPQQMTYQPYNGMPNMNGIILLNNDSNLGGLKNFYSPNYALPYSGINGFQMANMNNMPHRIIPTFSQDPQNYFVNHYPIANNINEFKLDRSQFNNQPNSSKPVHKNPNITQQNYQQKKNTSFNHSEENNNHNNSHSSFFNLDNPNTSGSIKNNYNNKKNNSFSKLLNKKDLNKNNRKSNFDSTDKRNAEKKLNQICDDSENHDIIENIDEILGFEDDVLADYVCSLQGSRNFQKILFKTGTDKLDVILEKLNTNFNKIFNDVYGNYFSQKLFQCCTSDQRVYILKKIKNEFKEISCHTSGTHSIQALVELINIQSEEDVIKDAIKDDVIQLAIDPNGTYVIQKIFSSISEHNRTDINNIILKELPKLSLDNNGVCVVKKLILTNKDLEIRELIYNYVEKNCLEIIQNPFGNYMIQQILESWPLETNKPILDTIVKNIGSLSMQKFSCNVVEKCLIMVDSTYRKIMIKELFNVTKIASIIKNKFGMHVLQRSIEIMRIEERAEIKEYLMKKLIITSKQEKMKLNTLINLIKSWILMNFYIMSKSFKFGKERVAS